LQQYICVWNLRGRGRIFFSLSQHSDWLWAPSR